MHPKARINIYVKQLCKVFVHIKLNFVKRIFYIYKMFSDILNNVLKKLFKIMTSKSLKIKTVIITPDTWIIKM